MLGGLVAPWVAPVHKDVSFAEKVVHVLPLYATV